MTLSVSKLRHGKYTVVTIVIETNFPVPLSDTMASAWECPFGSHSYLEVELENFFQITMATTAP